MKKRISLLLATVLMLSMLFGNSMCVYAAEINSVTVSIPAAHAGSPADFIGGISVSADDSGVAVNTVTTKVVVSGEHLLIHLYPGMDMTRWPSFTEHINKLI